MRVTMSYLGPLEQLWMQHICRWYYTTGASRVQTSVTLVSPKYFSMLFDNSLTQNLLAYTKGSDLVRLTCSNKEDYTSYLWYSCQVGKQMIFQVKLTKSRMLTVGPKLDKFSVQQKADSDIFR